MRKNIFYAVSTLVLSAALLLAIPFFTTYSVNTITVTVDGQVITFPDQEPVIIGNRTLVPVRGVFEEMGYEVYWDSYNRIARLTNEYKTIIIPADMSHFIVNGDIHTAEVPQRLINNRLMLPLRAVAEAVGATADWDAAQRNAVIMSPGQTSTPPSAWTPPPQPTSPPSLENVNIANLLYRQFYDVQHYFGSVIDVTRWFDGSIMRQQFAFHTGIIVRTSASLSTGSPFIDAIIINYREAVTPDGQPLYYVSGDAGYSRYFYFNDVNYTTTRDEVVAMYGPGDRHGFTGLVCSLSPRHLFYWGEFASDDLVVAFDFDNNGLITRIMTGNLFDPADNPKPVAPIMRRIAGVWGSPAPYGHYPTHYNTYLLRVFEDGSFELPTIPSVFNSGWVEVTGVENYMYHLRLVVEHITIDHTTMSYSIVTTEMFYVYNWLSDRIGKWIDACGQEPVIEWYVRVVV